MEPLEREILNRLAKAREHEQTNTNLNAIWRECGGVTPRDFAQAWGSLEAGELGYGGGFESAGRNEGLGKINTQRGEGREAGGVFRCGVKNEVLYDEGVARGATTECLRCADYT